MATLRVSIVTSGMIGLCGHWAVLRSSFVWNRSTSRSSCRCSNTIASSSRTTSTSISLARDRRHVSFPSYSSRWCVKSKFYKRQQKKFAALYSFAPFSILTLQNDLKPKHQCTDMADKTNRIKTQLKILTKYGCERDTVVSKISFYYIHYANERITDTTCIHRSTKIIHF